MGDYALKQIRITFDAKKVSDEKYNEMIKLIAYHIGLDVDNVLDEDESQFDYVDSKIRKHLYDNPFTYYVGDNECYMPKLPEGSSALDFKQNYSEIDGKIIIYAATTGKSSVKTDSSIFDEDDIKYELDFYKYIFDLYGFKPELFEFDIQSEYSKYQPRQFKKINI